MDVSYSGYKLPKPQHTALKHCRKKCTQYERFKEDMMALVEIDNISKNYQMGEVQVPALRNITLSIEEAAFVSFVGPAGSGKKPTVFPQERCLTLVIQKELMDECS